MDFPVKIPRKAEALYRRYEKFLPVVSFMGGFLWDSLTLNRIDRWSDNLILLAYLLLAGGFMVLVNFISHRRITHPWILKYREWYPLAIQFFLGGLFSSYVVFYFQSASFTKTFLFVLILIWLLVLNEFLEQRLTNLFWQVGLYFFSAFSFFIFFVPVVVKRMNWLTFFLSGFLGVALAGSLLSLFRRSKLLNNAVHRKAQHMIIALFLLLNVFYLLNWIPPVPLSLKKGGIYHHVHREGDRFVLRYQRPAWYQFWKRDSDPFRYQPGDTVFCFASVFAPTRLKKKIFHHWQYFDPRSDQWQTTDRLGYRLTGGRDGGYRGYTYKTHLRPGKWRVDVETGEGWLLGRIRFRIVFADSGAEDREFITQFY